MMAEADAQIDVDLNIFEQGRTHALHSSSRKMRRPTMAQPLERGMRGKRTFDPSLYLPQKGYQRILSGRGMGLLE